MKQTIEIEVPDGKKAVWKDGTIIFEDICPKLPKTWEEFCKQYPIKHDECYIDIDSKIELSGYGIRLKENDKNVLPNRMAAQSHLAFIQLHQLRDCYRQGWEPDWGNCCQDKHVIYIDNGKIRYGEYISISKFLSFQSREIAEKFIHNFKDLILQAKDLI